MNTKSKNILIFSVLLLLFAAGLYFSLRLGLSKENGSIILSYIRIPAVIKAIVAGSGLALAGMFLQAISKNPLADPYLTGLSSGAGLGMVISILCFNSINYSLFGFLGAVFVAFCVIIFSGLSKFSISKLILMGLSINIFAGAIISFLILTNADKAYAMTLILSGGFNNASISYKTLILLYVLGLILSAVFIPKLNLMRLDSNLIFSSEKKLRMYNIIFVSLSAFLTSISVYTAGILGFVGIIAPLLSLLLVGNDYRLLFFSNIFVGSTLLLFANILSTRLIYPVQIPLGIVVAFIGAPVFIYFLLKKGGIFSD